MKLRTRVHRLTMIATLLLALLVSAVVMVIIRNYAEEQARKEGLIVVEMAKIGLMHSMQEGIAFNDDKTHVRKESVLLFREFSKIPQLIEMRALRGEAVTRQYGEVPDRGEIEPVERRMLETGIPSEQIEVNEKGLKVFHYNGPLIASSSGIMNCMQCHNAREGEVLGGLSVQVDLTDAENAIKSAIYQMVSLLFLVGILFALILRRLFHPLVEVVSQLTYAFSRARSGDFSQRIEYENDDEIGEIVDSTNKLIDSLSQNVGAIASDVEDLTGRSLPSADLEPMEHMAMVVHNLTTAVRFKKEIEADRDLEEVYLHLQRVIKHDFGFDKFALYEVHAHNNRNEPVVMEGAPEALEGWCSTDVQGDSDACRAKRSVHIVDSRKDPEICPSFCGDCKEQFSHLRHICLPSLNSDGDGVILEIVFDDSDDEQMEEKVALLEYYLRIAAPDIEAKRLMKSLKEISMRDPLTGMYNRRFLDEFILSLESSVSRRESTLGVLMCDIDHFKQVNDNRGHASGDKVLVELANIFRELVRASDLIVRFGGEEVLVLLMDSDHRHTAEVAERIRTNVEAHMIRDNGGTFSVTISLGLAMYPEHASDLNICINNADEALYDAKRSGRNRVVHYQNESGPEQS